MDYRYFPEPDLPPITIDMRRVKEILDSLPEHPDDVRQRFLDIYGLSQYEASVLTLTEGGAAYYEAVLKELGINRQSLTAEQKKVAKEVCNWMTNDLFKSINDAGLSLATNPIPPSDFASLLSLLTTRKVTGKAGKEIVLLRFTPDYKHKTVEAIVKEKGWYSSDDASTEIVGIVERVLASNEEAVQQVVTQGPLADRKQKYLLGQVMKETKGKIDGQLAQSTLQALLAARM